MQVRSADRLDAETLVAVLALSASAEALDGVAPLSEQVLLAARSRDTSISTPRTTTGPTSDEPTGLPTGLATDDPTGLASGLASDGPTGLASGTVTGSGPGAATGPAHFLAYAGSHLAGYAHLERAAGGPGSGPVTPKTAPATAEVVVDPADRRRGVGTMLIQAVEDALGPAAASLQIWSHGHLEGARAFAIRDGYVNVRELWAMRRSLGRDAPALPFVSLPEGFESRHFVVGQDEGAWLRVNARAFADHPEQGRITRADLDLRIGEPWFDATGLILVEDARGPAPVLAASHWTKVVPAADPSVGPTEGEVYVVGVDPAYQGLGLGTAVTVLGLEHLRERGLSQAMLYVDADNAAAVATYSRLGFTRFAVDVKYSRAARTSSATIGT
jgi:mycothiol synthase